MAPSTALLFLLYGAALFLRLRFPNARLITRLPSLLTLMGIFIALLLLVFSSFGMYLHAEYMGMNISGSVGGAPIGHMSPFTALCFVIVGTSLVLQHYEGRQLYISFWLAAATFLTSFVLIVGYLVGAPLFYETGIIPPAMTTSLAFLILALALMSSAGLKIWPHDALHDDTSIRSTIFLILIFMLLVTGILSTGYLYSRNLQSHFRRQAEAELAAIADFKVKELQQWRRQRFDDASLFFQNPVVSTLVSQLLSDSGDLEKLRQLQIWLQKFQENSDYEKVFLTDVNGIEKFAVPLDDKYEENIKKADYIQAAQSRQITFLDVYRDSFGQRLFLDVIVPIFNSPNWDKLLGFLVFRIDPEHFLFPMIRRWPITNKTAECLLVRRDGNDVLFINELRFNKNAALSLRFPLTKKDLPAAKAAQGKEGAVEGIDYRGVRVLAVSRIVADSPWYIVAKIDEDEIERPLYERLLWIAGLISSLLFGSGTIVGFIWRNQQVQFYRFKYIAAQATEDSEKNLLLIFESSKDGIMVANAETKQFVVANKAICDMLGYSREELLSLSVKDIHPMEEVPIIVEKFESQVREEISIVANVPMKRRDGSIFYADINTTLIEYGKTTCLLGTFRDITDRMQAEARIEHLNRVLRAIRNINQLIVKADSADELIKSACKLLVDHGSYVSALIILVDSEGNPMSHVLAGLDADLHFLEDQIVKGQLPECCKAADMVNGVYVINGENKICKVCDNFDHCASAKKMTMCLRHQERSYGYLTVTVDMDIALDSEEGRLFFELAGDLAYSLHNIEIKNALLVAEQDTKKVEAQLLQAQKMESVGRLAGGVAHDFNNMLSVILGFSELALEKVSSVDPLHEDLSEIHNAAVRSTEITRQLLAFARKQTIAPVALDLNVAVESMLKMLRRLIGEDIDLAWLPEASLWPVMMDPSQVDQLLANLCVNARDAIEGVGKVTIETHTSTFDAAYCSDHPGFVPGDYVLLAVSDDGCGMDRDTVDKIFEPFFTTKDVGQGTGLGLATVYGIVKQNNGFINVYSEPGKGSTFKIYLARHTESAVISSSKGPEGSPVGNGEMILVVEDEISILKYAQKVLEELGYAVLIAKNPNQALQMAQENSTKIDLLITDVIMPEMNGRELASRMHKTFPGLKTLFMSGYTANVIAHQGVLDKDVNFIQKPFSKESMAVKIREALDL